MTARQSVRLTKAARRRLGYALVGIVVVLCVGALGFHALAGFDAVNSVYFESMLATGQGPPFPLPNDASKIFASVMAFVSVGSVVSALLFAVAPVVRQIWRTSIEYVEDEVRTVEHDLERH